MKMKNRWLCMLFTLLMVLSLTACGKKGGSNSDIEMKSSKDYVYAMTEIPIRLNHDTEISDIYICGDKLVAYGIKYNYGDSEIQPRDEAAAKVVVENAEETPTEATEEMVTEATEEMVTESTEESATEDEMQESNTVMEVATFHMDGTEISGFSESFTGDIGINGFNVDSNGNIYFVLVEYGKDNSNPDNTRDVFTLFSYNEEGKENWNIALGKDVKDDEYYYVNQMLIDQENRIILTTSNGFEVYGADSKIVNSIPLTDEDSSAHLVLLNGTECGMLCYGEGAMYMKKVDITTGKLSEAIKFPFNTYSYNFSSGVGADLFLTDNSGVYSYNLGDTELKKIMDYVDSDLMIENLFSIRPVDEKTIIGIYFDGENGITKCASFAKVDPSQIKDKQVLTLGCSYVDSDVRRHVVEYNKNNPNYRIKIMDYSIYNTENDYMAAITKLNTDIVAGNMPDILLLSSDMPINSYVAKGLLADFNPLIEADSEIHREDYLENIFDAVSADGKLYQLTPGFYVFTVFGKESIVGGKQGWTFDDLEKLLADKGDDVVAFSDLTKSDFMNYSMWFCNNEYINWQTGECTFNQPPFIKVLEYAKQLPDEINYDNRDDSYWDNFQKSYRDGKTLLMMYSLSSFEDYNMCEVGTFGDTITPIGFPSEDTNGSALSFNLDFGISEKSANKQAAWDFIRYFLTDEYQSKMEYCFPVKKSQLDILAKKAQEKPYYLDEDGEKVEYDNTYFLNGEEVPIPPMTKEQTDKVIAFIHTVSNVMDYNDNINDIISEESKSFFSGQKSSQEVASIIQSRIQIYVNENR